MDHYQVVITSTAFYDLSSIITFVSNVSKEAAIQLSNDLKNSISSLSTFPERNPVFEMPSTFKEIIRQHIVNKRYIVLYSIENNSVVVHRILDSRRKFNHLISQL